MSRYVEFDLPDGSTVVIESDGPDGSVVKAGLGEVAERARESFEQAAENARNAALVIVDKIRSLYESPDEIEITFGLKASGELNTLVVAKTGIEASYTVRLTWRQESPEIAQPSL
ncbi:MAG: hypothetical protein F9K13_11475 [Candidatus Methylomirabilis oxygeniifera]|uniref:Trypsin-co-occurring domain-containing protein n=1 Tax=Methylomirabilis oxygeniifera TaxID=671143 RepID=D5MK93_METO1|nr:MAG: hypothetical protein F9K13_11475 [Candidatus Methylomirabilis oxyfera]CBE69715.1 conserved protein of unknown function [Candidatus Methylomirabilis oxyfera]